MELTEAGTIGELLVSWCTRISVDSAAQPKSSLSFLLTENRLNVAVVDRAETIET